MRHALKVGDERFFVPNQRNGHGRGMVRVEKVGRKWAALSNGLRACLATGQVEGGGFGMGSLHESEAAYEDRRNALNLFRAITRQWTLPPGITAENVCEAARLLGLEDCLAGAPS